MGLAQAPSAPQGATLPPPSTPITSPSDNRTKYKFSLWHSPLAILIYAAIASAIIIPICLAISSIFNGPNSKVSGTRTTMIYMIGSNLESENGAATADLEEMLDAKHNTQDNHVLIYTGGSSAWYAKEVSADENAIFSIENGQLVKLESYPRSPMTDPNNLTAFIDYATSHSGSDLYDLILWDHGGGPIFGYGLDENSLSQRPMSLAELTSAISSTNLVKNNRTFDYIGFDACLMGSAEVARALQPYAHYLISSEEVEPGFGWDYSFLSQATTTETTERLATDIIDRYANFYENNYRYRADYSLSVLDLTKLEKVLSGADSLFSKVSTDITASTFANYSRALTRNVVYGAASRDGESYDLVDLQDLSSAVNDIFPSEVASLTTAIDDAVIYSRTNIADTHGLSIYFPTKNKQNLNLLLSRYKDVAISQGYYDFLLRYGGYIADDNLATRTVSSDFSASSSQEGITIDIPPELASNYQSAKFNILRKLSDNHFMPVYQSSDVQLNGNQLSIGSGSTALQFAVFDKDNQPHYMLATETARTAEYTDYYTITVSEIVDPNAYFGYSDRNLNIFFRIKKGESVATIKEIKDVTKPSGDSVNESINDLSAKASIDLKDVTTLRFFNGIMKYYDDNGVLLENGPESWQTPLISVFNLSKDTFRIELVDLDFDYGDLQIKGASGQEDFTIPNSASKDFYCQVAIYDVQGNVHKMDLVHIIK